MKRKVIACVMGLVLALSLAACGEEEVVVENTNAEVTVAVQTTEAAETPAETVAEADVEAEGGPLLQVEVMEIPDLSGTEWTFAGGMIDGVEMEEEDLNATLETYGGTLGLVFGEDGAVTMVQGGGNAEGTYEYSDDNKGGYEFVDDNGRKVYSIIASDDALKRTIITISSLVINKDATSGHTEGKIIIKGDNLSDITCSYKINFGASSSSEIPASISFKYDNGNVVYNRYTFRIDGNKITWIYDKASLMEVQ